MKLATRTLLLVGVAIVVLWAAPAMAFHDEGVAHCNGCHTMHNSQDGQLVDPDSPNGNEFLLVDATPSDVCLGCHAYSRGAVLGDDPLNPPPEKGGGKFIFLTEDNLNDGHAGGDPANWIPGEAAGHNVVSPGFGLVADSTLAVSPGGAFPSSQLGCTSCHDPHGTDAFRLLYGAGRIIQDFYTFTNPSPEAVGLSIFSGTEANNKHTAYNAGMSEWCANCHGNFHDEAGGRLEHPSGSNIGGSIATAYGLYNGTAQYQTGNPATSYLALVPYEDPAVTTTSTGAPNASSNVMCLTCHRAHASSGPDSGRWDFNVTFLSEDGIESGSWPIPDPYNDPDNQRSLCNKCHVQDAFDLGSAP